MDRTILRRMAAFLCLAALLAANGFACFAGDSFDFGRDNLPLLPKRISLARRLVDAWLDGRI